MVRSGWALSFVRYSHDYDREEEAAREAKAGLWAGAFIAPWDWRHRNKATVVLGALKVPHRCPESVAGRDLIRRRAIPGVHDQGELGPR
jgi:hypothetical protein